MGVFDGLSEKDVKEAKHYERGNYISPGTYLVEVLKFKEGQMRPPKKTDFVVAEMKVLESSDLVKHPLKSTVTWMATADKDAFIGNVKHFVAAASNVDEKEITLKELKEATGEDNPLQGVLLRVNAKNVKTKADKDFTHVQFSFAGMSDA